MIVPLLRRLAMVAAPVALLFTTGCASYGGVLAGSRGYGYPVERDARRYVGTVDRYVRLDRRQADGIFRLVVRRADHLMRHTRRVDQRYVYPFPRRELRDMNRAQQRFWYDVDRDIRHRLSRRQAYEYDRVFGGYRGGYGGRVYGSGGYGGSILGGIFGGGVFGRTRRRDRDDRDDRGDRDDRRRPSSRGDRDEQGRRSGRGDRENRRARNGRSEAGRRQESGRATGEGRSESRSETRGSSSGGTSSPRSRSRSRRDARRDDSRGDRDR